MIMRTSLCAVKGKGDGMRIGDIGSWQSVACAGDASVQSAALLMRKHHVGDLVVLGADQSPVGIITDRDIVVSVIALGLDPASLLVSDIMSADLFTAREDDDLVDTIEHMRARGIRRVPLISKDGKLSGVVSLDDVLTFLAEEMGDLARIGMLQQAHEKRVRL